MTILDKIVQYKRKEIEIFKKKYVTLYDLPLNDQNSASLIETIENDYNVSVIAEIKKGSPSKGIFKDSFDIKNLVSYYTKNKASCISVLTDQEFFYGSFDVLKQVRSNTNLPILCKDFILDDIQIRLAKYHGANVILLIKRILSNNEFESLLKSARKHNLEVLVEVDSVYEFEKIKNMDFKLCGVNNRNLSDFSISLDKTKELAPYILDSGKYLISESGISTPNQVKELRPHGISGILVGESLIKDEHMVLLKQLQIPKASPQIKICGIKTVKQALLLDQLHVDYIGLVFAKSKRKVNKKTAMTIRENIKHSYLVGVFMNQNAEDITEIYESCHLDFVQIHGDFNFNTLNIPTSKIIRAIAYTEEIPLNFDHILIDNLNPGSGNDFDYDISKENKKYNYFLAGGLTVENVSDKIRTYQPAVVDVSSGVETNGEKDVRKVEQFIEKVRGV